MTLAHGAALVLGAAAVIEDLRDRRISNWLTGGAVLAGLLLGAGSAGWSGLGSAAGGAAVGFVAFLPFHLSGGLGGGDIKLMAAFGSILGPAGIGLAAVLAAIVGAVMAAVAALRKPGTRTIAYAPAIVAGAWLSMWGRG
jgi:prepilin peptidase CpaA